MMEQKGFRSYFTLSDSKLDVRKLKQELENPKAGALVTFEGWVRNHNDGRSVERLDYEAFEALAETEGNRIIAEALARFDIEEAICIHRTGRLIIGDCAVWVGAISAHRDAAFQAARYIIDAIKTRLPIWKKEHYKSGEAVWVNCQQCAHAANSDSIEFHALSLPNGQRMDNSCNAPQVTVSEADYYQRQVCLPEIGADGQRKLKESRVLVVGAGGLGGSALQYLAGAGIGHLGICEFDRLEVSNLHRQVLYAASEVGRFKAELAARRLQNLNPNIHIEVYGHKLAEQELLSLLQDYDLVLDCTDNFEIRFLLNGVAVRLQKPLIQASVYQYEGQIQLVVPGMGGCLRCQWPDLPEDAPLENCIDHGVIGAVSGMFGTLQAMEAIKWIVGLPTSLTDRVLMMDLLTYQQHLIRREARPALYAASFLISDWPGSGLPGKAMKSLRVPGCWI
jgi:sulfur-carrier protein adenylyltransferase/sulfurtransferase